MIDSKAPAGPSGPLKQTYNQLPFVNSPFISRTRNTKMARGMIVAPVTVAANTAITITHNLGRKVQGMICISNGAHGEAFPPQFALVVPPTAGAIQSSSQATVQANATATQALLWVF
jgi:hypothetical protein